MNQAQRWHEHDRYGNLIYMTEERWHHALEKRPWLEECLDEVLKTIQKGRREQDPLNPRKYKYYLPCDLLLPEFNHLVVVVLVSERSNESNQTVPNNHVTNVWAVFIYGKR